MSHNVHANRANPYLSPGDVPTTSVTGAESRLPWFCRIAFAWSCFLCVVAVSPEMVRMATAPDTGWSGPAWLTDGTLSLEWIRWGFCGLGLIANALLLSGRRSGLWVAYVYLFLGTFFFALVVVSLRAGALPWGSGAGGVPGIAAVALFAFVGGGSIGYYVLALHEFRNWTVKRSECAEETPV